MHTFTETGTGVPAFLAKLWRLVDDPETNNLICWSKDGRSFIIQNQAQFARELLPLNYKHNNMASFIRQLNMYGFHKITSIDNGGLKFDRDEMEFSHPCFKRNCPYLLEHIKRKIANTKSIDEKSAIKPEAVSKVLQDVKAMRGRQDSLDSRFSVMKQENEALWREIASLRQKHAKQQQIVNKLIQFLITIVQPSRNMTSVKRHMQLMINDSPDNAKLRKTSESETDCGPVIHELSEELLDEVAENELDLMDPNSPYAASVSTVHLDNESLSPHNIERPHSSNSMLSQNYDYSNHSADDVLNTVGIGGNAGAAGASGKGGQSIIQSVSPDGSKIVYHVTEVPDAHPAETVKTVPANIHDDNVLTTPMVREQTARSQLLKQKNKQRRNQMASSNIVDGEGRTSSPVAVKLLRQNQKNISSKNEQEMQIKLEQEIDPMLFLNVYPDNRIFTPDPHMISPNPSEESCQSNGNQRATLTNASTLTTKSAPINNRPSELYNPDDFMATDMPTDIFEDSSLIGGENSNFDDNFKASKQIEQKQQQKSEKQQQQQQQQEQQQQQKLQQQQQEFGFNTASTGKFASLVSGNNNPIGASTSAAAAAAANTAGLSGAANSSTSATNRNQNKDKTGNGNGNAMAVTKYSKTGSNNNDGGVLRLSTPEEVHGHLDNMQDELESLKDLLRGDGYSLDSNTLMGNGATSATLNNNRIYLNHALDGDFFNKLFNDADILGPYGLSFSNENSSDKKGSELMAYQPIYDLSDIMGINDKADLDEGNSISSPSANPRQLEAQSSVLNTPRHE